MQKAKEDVKVGHHFCAVIGQGGRKVGIEGTLNFAMGRVTLFQDKFT